MNPYVLLFGLAAVLVLAPGWASAWVRVPRDSAIVIRHQVQRPRATVDSSDRWPPGQPRFVVPHAGPTIITVEPPNSPLRVSVPRHFDGVETPRGE